MPGEQSSGIFACAYVAAALPANEHATPRNASAINGGSQRGPTMMLKTTIRSGCAALALLALGVLAHPTEAASVRREANGALRYYDDNGFDRGYAWCLRRANRAWGGSTDCSYYSYAQCRAAQYPPGGDCIPNPFAADVTEPPPPRRGRR
jgi:hypothetical protein